MNGGWLRHLIETGRLPLFCFFAGVVIGFLFIRLSVRLIRANVRWWPGDIKPKSTAKGPIKIGRGWPDGKGKCT